MAYRAKILVIDDEIDIVDLLEMLLVAEGYQVVPASNGIDGLREAEVHQPDLILLDLMMPGMDGYAVISALKNKPSLADTPVIMLTALAQAKEKIQGLTAGAEDYITKPFDTKELILRIESVLNRTLPVKYINPLISAMGDWFSPDAIEELAAHLQIAAAIQKGLKPKNLPQIPGFDIASYLRSSMSISGDFYDFIQLDDHCFGLVIADVRGKGIPAALLMVMIRTALRLVSREEAVNKTSTTANVLKRVNDLIATDTDPDLFATVVYGILDVPSKMENIHQPCTFTYTNAGHCYPLHLVDGQVRSLKTGGLVLGSFDFADFDEQSIVLEAGQILLFYTDGIIEAEAPNGQPYGEERLKQILLHNSHLSADGICQQTVDSLDRFIQTGNFDSSGSDDFSPELSSQLKDDLALVVVKVEANQVFDLENN